MIKSLDNLQTLKAIGDHYEALKTTLKKIYIHPESCASYNDLQSLRNHACEALQKADAFEQKYNEQCHTIDELRSTIADKDEHIASLRMSLTE